MCVRLVSWLVCLFGRLVGLFVCSLVGFLVGCLVAWLVGGWVGGWVGRSVGRSVGRWGAKSAVCGSCGWDVQLIFSDAHHKIRNASNLRGGVVILSVGKPSASTHVGTYCKIQPSPFPGTTD